jgi:hypothetical protein
MPKWRQLLDSIKRWINEKLGTNFQVTDRGALSVLAAAHKRFKSGERIIREIDSGVLKTAETAQDAEYLAAVERGDMETAQRMVDEAAKKAGYNSPKVYHGSSDKPFNIFKIQKLFRHLPKAHSEKLPPPRRKRGFFENSLDRCGKDFSDFVTDDHLEILSDLHIIDGEMDHILGDLQSLAPIVTDDRPSFQPEVFCFLQSTKDIRRVATSRHGDENIAR